jgi:phosphoribosyl-AMP cyclohydrolase
VYTSAWLHVHLDLIAIVDSPLVLSTLHWMTAGHQTHSNPPVRLTMSERPSIGTRFSIPKIWLRGGKVGSGDVVEDIALEERCDVDAVTCSVKTSTTSRNR